MMKRFVELVMALVLAVTLVGAVSAISNVYPAQEHVTASIKPYHCYFCYDSDGGLAYDVSGHTIYRNRNVPHPMLLLDRCEGDTLMEGYCVNRRTGEYAEYNCPYGCSEGACIAGNPSCSDTDGGIIYNVTGTVYVDSGNGTNYSVTDYCINNSTLREYYCVDPNLGNASWVQYTCPFGCSAGACQQPPVDTTPPSINYTTNAFFVSGTTWDLESPIWYFRLYSNSVNMSLLHEESCGGYWCDLQYIVPANGWYSLKARSDGGSKTVYFYINETMNGTNRTG